MKNCLSLFFLSFLLLSFTSHNTFAAQESKTYKKSFSIGKAANLILDTEFTDINIVHHDKAEIIMEVTVKVECSKAEKAKKMLDRIQVEMEQSANDVKMEIDMEQNVNNVSLDIQATIYAPSYINLNAETEYGNLNLGEITGTCDIDLEFGALTIGKLLNEKGENKLDLEYCDPAIIGLVKKVNISADYSTVKVKAAGDLGLKGDYSDFAIGKAIALRAKMDYGSLLTSEVGGIYFEGDYVTVQLDKILEIANFEMDYGSLLVKSLSQKFKALKLTADFLDATIRLGNLKSFVIDGNLEFSDVSVPDFVKTKKSDITGLSLSGGSGEAQFIINMDYGNLNILQ